MSDELDADRDGWSESGDASDEHRGRFRRLRGALMPTVVVVLVLTCAGLGVPRR